MDDEATNETGQPRANARKTERRGVQGKKEKAEGTSETETERSEQILQHKKHDNVVHA